MIQVFVSCVAHKKSNLTNVQRKFKKMKTFPQEKQKEFI